MESWKSTLLSLDRAKTSTRVMQEMAGKIDRIPNATVQEIIRNAASEIEKLEEAAKPQNALSALTPQIAEDTVALWVFSGPDDKNDKDRYRHIPWAHGMDKARLDYAAWLERKISEIRMPSQPKTQEKGQIRQEIDQTREMIKMVGPVIIYNGSDPLNENLNSELQKDIIIPKNKVAIEGSGIVNTVDQIKDFVLPTGLHQPGKEIGIISHAPHLMRIAHMLNRFQTLPKDMKVRFFPIATPKNATQEYSELETMGLLFYIANGSATKDTYQYTIHGGK